MTERRLKATVLVDNIGKDSLKGEWGLSIYLEYERHRILLDCGASALFLENARALGKELKQVEHVVLSHAHYDHANGLIPFFKYNAGADVWLQESCRENCYGKWWLFHKYIGIPKGITKKYSGRFTYVSGNTSLLPGVTFIAHSTPGLSEIGSMEHMYVREKGRWYADDFSHEQSLVFETQNGLVIFNSCSHGGADTIIKEVQKAFPGRKVYALIGGFHLFNKTESYIRDLAERIRETGIAYVYTGHCTGGRAFRILQEKLKGTVTVQQFSVGLEMEF